MFSSNELFGLEPDKTVGNSDHCNVIIMQDTSESLDHLFVYQCFIQTFLQEGAQRSVQNLGGRHVVWACEAQIPRGGT